MVRYAFVGLAAAVAVSMVLAFSPGSRRAVAQWLGLRGVTIERETTVPTGLGGALDLGEPAALADAQHRIGFDLLVPHGFGPPDEVYVADTPSGDRVDLLYRAGPRLPSAAGSGVGMLLTEFRADAVALRKGVAEDAPVEFVTVGGGNGIWLEGVPHTVAFTDDEGGEITDSTRLAGNTLLWERDGLTLRLESGLTKDDAIRVAESLVPITS